MHIAIIGNGISGITAARWIRKLSQHRISVISSESRYFYSRPALMYIYMGHMKYRHTKPYEDWFWEKNKIDLIQDHVTQIKFAEKSLITQSGQRIEYDKLIIASGSRSNKFGWPGQDLEAVSGLYSLQDLENIEKYSQNLERAVIVGGGLIGIELAEMFHSRNIQVTMLIREEQYWDNILPIEEASLISKHIYAHHIDLRLKTELKEILDNGEGKACAVITNQGERINSGFVGLTPGVSPNVNFLINTELEVQRGILVNERLETNVPDVYAVGDCVQLKTPMKFRAPVEALWYTGRIMGETVAYNVCGKPVKYDPGIWYNSAKFLQIEYQVYGTVLNHPPEEHNSFYWENPNGQQSLRIVFEGATGTVIGFNLLGLRFRQEVCEKWIMDKTNLETVLTNLSLANFDPEFHTKVQSEILKQYNIEYKKNLIPEKSKTVNKILEFLES